MSGLEAEKLIECATQFHDVCALDESGQGEAKGVEHAIDIMGSQQIRQAARIRKEISKMVQEMLKSGVVQESTSPWSTR